MPDEGQLGSSTGVDLNQTCLSQIAHFYALQRLSLFPTLGGPESFASPKKVHKTVNFLRLEPKMDLKPPPRYPFRKSL